MGISVCPNLAGGLVKPLACFINIAFRCPMDDTDFETMFDMPGGHGYREVTDVFREAGRGKPSLQRGMGRSLKVIL